VLLCIAGAVARADDTIALLPLDAEPRLEAFGQPVAGEIGRVLIADKLDVIVVGAKMAVPATAKLIVDGSLTRKGDAIVLQIRLRNPTEGTVLDKLEEVAPNLLGIEKASITLSARLVPVVRARLAAMKTVTIDKPITTDKPVKPAHVDPILLVGIGVPRDASPMIEPLRRALTTAVGSWAHASQRTPSTVDASMLGKQLAPQTVATAQAERAVAFEILDYTIVPLAVPLARARVRIRIADATGVQFDRVIATDTVVGDRKITGEMLADRVAREVLTILRPHMKRVEPAWH
jgi:hypothetical protein